MPRLGPMEGAMEAMVEEAIVGEATVEGVMEEEEVMEDPCTIHPGIYQIKSFFHYLYLSHYEPHP